MQRKLDTTLAQTKLDWTPKIRVEEDLKRTVVYFDSRLAGAA